MKLHSLVATAALLPASLFAGETVVYEPAPAPMAPVQDFEALNWFFGGSAGYLIDAEEAFYSGHIGKELFRTDKAIHSLFLEVGFADLENDDDNVEFIQDSDTIDDITDGDSFTGSSDIEAEFVPITLNYKLDYQFTPRFGAYIGAGAGVAIIDADGDFASDLGDIPASGNDSDTSFFAQAFVGLDYKLTDNFELFTGVRYMIIDDYEIAPEGFDEIDVSSNDDLLVELGGRFLF